MIFATQQSGALHIYGQTYCSILQKYEKKNLTFVCVHWFSWFFTSTVINYLGFRFPLGFLQPTNLCLAVIPSVFCVWVTKEMLLVSIVSGLQNPKKFLRYWLIFIHNLLTELVFKGRRTSYADPKKSEPYLFSFFPFCAGFTDGCVP